jgi:toxin ParE1/3/4
MKFRVHLARHAINDLAEIHAYLLPLAGAITARRYVEDIRAYCDQFAHFPERGTLRDDLRKGLRIIGYKRKVTIALRVDADRVTVLRVLGRGRDLGEVFGPLGEPRA